MTAKKRSSKSTRHPKKDLVARKSGEIRGGRDAATGLPTGKRLSKP